MMGREDLIDHPDYAKNGDRVKNRDQIKPIVVEWTKTQTADDLVNRLLEAGIPTAPIYDVKQVTEDPHIAGAREMFIDIEDPEVGSVKVTNTHIKMSGTKQGFRFTAPTLGQHNEEIYGDLLGYTPEEIQKMREDGFI